MNRVVLINIPRNTKDSTDNNFGDHLSAMCIELGIHVLNGRTPGDLTGEITNITENGRSIVDYMLTEPNMFNVVKSFNVLDVPESNHLPLLCKLNLSFNPTEAEGNDANNTFENVSDIPKFKWENEERLNFLNTLSDVASIDTLNSMLDLDENDLEEAVNVFVSVLHRAAEPMAVKSRKGKKKILQPKWWCKECEKLKTKKYECLKRFKLSNTDADLRSFREARNNFKNFCKLKSSQWKSKLRDRLIGCKSNPTEFWKTVKNVAKEQLQPSNLITAGEWFCYFEKLLNQNVNISEEFESLVQDFTESHDSECGICNGQELGSPETQELNDHISAEEILKSVKEMSNGKAPGIDGIIIEMLKCSHYLIFVIYITVC